MNLNFLKLLLFGSFFFYCDVNAEVEDSDQLPKAPVTLRNANIECKDKDERFCPYYVRIYGDRLCEAPCEDKNERYCPSYVRIYGKRFCDADWFINGERYGCKKSCELC